MFQLGPAGLILVSGPLFQLGYFSGTQAKQRSEQSTRHFSGWFPVLVPSNPEITCFEGNIPPCPCPQQSPSSLNKVLHFQFLHLSWHGFAAVWCCFLVCMGTRLHGCRTHTNLDSNLDPQLAIVWLQRVS